MSLSHTAQAKSLSEHPNSALPFTLLPPANVTTHSQPLWRKTFSKEAFLSVLKCAPHRLCETTAVSRLIEPQAAVLSLMLTTVTCYRLPIAQWVSEALAEHYQLRPNLQNNIHTALHEALSNAVIHGNLSMGSQSTDIRGLRSYYATIAALLEQPERRFACIAISVQKTNSILTLRVCDEGNGYTPSHTARDVDDEFSLTRGLSIIHDCSYSMRVSRGGRTIEMDFAVAP